MIICDCNHTIQNYNSNAMDRYKKACRYTNRPSFFGNPELPQVDPGNAVRIQGRDTSWMIQRPKRYLLYEVTVAERLLSENPSSHALIVVKVPPINLYE